VILHKAADNSLIIKKTQLKIAKNRAISRCYIHKSICYITQLGTIIRNIKNNYLSEEQISRDITSKWITFLRRIETDYEGWIKTPHSIKQGSRWLETRQGYLTY